MVSALLSLGGGGPSEFSTPDDQGFFQQATLLEVGQQCGNSLVTGIGQPLVSPGDVPVSRVPGNVIAIDGMGELDLSRMA